MERPKPKFNYYDRVIVLSDSSHKLSRGERGYVYNPTWNADEETWVYEFECDNNPYFKIYNFYEWEIDLVKRNEKKTTKSRG